MAQYGVKINGFRVIQETYDDMHQLDGTRDETQISVISTILDGDDRLVGVPSQKTTMQSTRQEQAMQSQLKYWQRLCTTTPWSSVAARIETAGEGPSRRRSNGPTSGRQHGVYRPPLPILFLTACANIWPCRPSTSCGVGASSTMAPYGNGGMCMNSTGRQPSGQLST